MLPSSPINIFQYLFVQTSAPGYTMSIWLTFWFADEMKFGAWHSNIAIHHANWIKRQAHVNKRNDITVSYMPKEALKAYLFPKEMRYFISEHAGARKDTSHIINMANEASAPVPIMHTFLKNCDYVLEKYGNYDTTSIVQAHRDQVVIPANLQKK
ncbi:hypothetical protein G6F43_008736 [Rhizopus delemar]|nr:hypothetical protein G6F43_008736 [Rhizopus delemar]